MDIELFRATWARLPQSLRGELAHNCLAHLTQETRERNGCYIAGAAKAFKECGHLTAEDYSYVLALSGQIGSQTWTRTFVRSEWRAEQ